MAYMQDVLGTPWCGVGCLPPIDLICVSCERESQHKPMACEEMTDSTDHRPIR